MREALHGHIHDSSKACLALDQWLEENPQIRTLATYSPLPGEVDVLHSVARHPQLDWVHPKVSSETLTFLRAKRLVPGAFSILEPIDGSDQVEMDEIDAFLCPGLAFDSRGGRLGRGRGFYDRALAHARADALKIGVCFECQVVPETFQEPHDIRMDLLIF